MGDLTSQNTSHAVMARPLRERFHNVTFRDKHNYGFGEVKDFLKKGPIETYDWVITNPPFNKATEFALGGLWFAERGVAILARTQFMEGKSRYETLFSQNPLSIIAPFVERVPMVKGRVDPKASTATSYAWFVWDNSISNYETKVIWIPPCRKELERPGDYG